MFRVTRYPMISKTESGRVSKEIPGSGSGSGTRWALAVGRLWPSDNDDGGSNDGDDDGGGNNENDDGDDGRDDDDVDEELAQHS